MSSDPIEPILSIRDLSISFKNEKSWNQVVNALNLDLSKGKTLGIVGESGSGKSVSCLAVMGLVPQSGIKISGEILFRPSDKLGPDSPNSKFTDLLKLQEKEKRAYRGDDIAMIFQEPMTSLNPVYTCGEQVAEAIRLHRKTGRKEAEEQTLSLFEEVQLPQPTRIYKSYPHQLSGGQKQRVMIAMALSCNPRVLIADEPTTALDVTVQHTIIELLKRLQNQRQMSMLFISHDLGIISEIADDVLVMLRGKVVETGKANQVFSQPEHPYTRGLLACRPARNQGLKRLPVISDFMETSTLGEIIEKETSIEAVRKNLEFSAGEKDKRQSEIYSHEPILVVSGLNKVFKRSSGWLKTSGTEVKAVNQVSLNVYKGETLGLVGESGSGKTTLGRSILRLVEPDSGSIRYAGNDLLTMKTNELRQIRKKMQIIFQDPYSSLNPRQTVGQTIMEPMQVFGLFHSESERKNRAMELLQRVNMQTSYFDRYPHEFSGGQRQRIGIARALSVEPEFIICDESVSALDVSVQAQIINLLISLREEFKLTYIFISHDLSVVRFISDRILVMNKGRIEEEGTPKEIYENPQSEYTRRLISSIPMGKGV